MMKMKTVKEAIPILNSIFTKMDYQFPEQFDITATELDMLFVANYGMRFVAPIVYAVQEDQTQIQLTSEELEVLSQLILNFYKVKWDKQVAVFDFVYDPIHNFSDTIHEEIEENAGSDTVLTHNTEVATSETTDIDTVVTDGGTERHDKALVSTKTRTDNLSESIATDETKTEVIDGEDVRTDNLTESSSSSSDHGIYGFNSATASGADSDAGAGSRLNTGTQTTESDVSDTTTVDSDVVKSNTGTQRNEDSSNEQLTITGGLTHTTDDSHVVSGTKAKTGTDSTEVTTDKTRERDYTRSGNIGNLTTQQLVTQEIQLWRWNFIQEVLNDVKDFLTLPVYG